MKHITEFGQIGSKELHNLLAKIEELIQPIMKEVSPVEALCIAKHVSSSASYIATREAVLKSFEKKVDSVVEKD